MPKNVATGAPPKQLRAVALFTGKKNDPKSLTIEGIAVFSIIVKHSALLADDLSNEGKTAALDGIISDVKALKEALDQSGEPTLNLTLLQNRLGSPGDQRKTALTNQLFSFVMNVWTGVQRCENDRTKNGVRQIAVGSISKGNLKTGRYDTRVVFLHNMSSYLDARLMQVDYKTSKLDPWETNALNGLSYVPVRGGSIVEAIILPLLNSPHELERHVASIEGVFSDLLNSLVQQPLETNAPPVPGDSTTTTFRKRNSILAQDVKNANAAGLVQEENGNYTPPNKAAQTAVRSGLRNSGNSSSSSRPDEKSDATTATVLGSALNTMFSGFQSIAATIATPPQPAQVGEKRNRADNVENDELTNQLKKQKLKKAKGEAQVSKQNANQAKMKTLMLQKQLMDQGFSQAEINAALESSQSE